MDVSSDFPAVMASLAKTAEDRMRRLYWAKHSVAIALQRHRRSMDAALSGVPEDVAEVSPAGSVTSPNDSKRSISPTLHESKPHPISLSHGPGASSHLDGTGRGWFAAQRSEDPPKSPLVIQTSPVLTAVQPVRGSSFSFTSAEAAALAATLPSPLPVDLTVRRSTDSSHGSARGLGSARLVAAESSPPVQQQPRVEPPQMKRSTQLWAKLRHEVLVKRTFSTKKLTGSKKFMRIIDEAVQVDKDKKASQVHLKLLMSGRVYGKATVSARDLFVDQVEQKRRVDLGPKASAKSNLHLMSQDELGSVAAKTPLLYVDGNLRLMNVVPKSLLSRLSTQSMLLTSHNSTPTSRRDLTPQLPRAFLVRSSEVDELKATQSMPNMLSKVRNTMREHMQRLSSPLSAGRIVPIDTPPRGPLRSEVVHVQSPNSGGLSSPIGTVSTRTSARLGMVRACLLSLLAIRPAFPLSPSRACALTAIPHLASANDWKGG